MRLNRIISMRIPLRVIFFFILPLVFAGCAAFSRSEQPAHPDLIHLENGGQVGQSFLSRYDGLQGIAVFIKPTQDSSGILSLDLYERQGTQEPVRTASLITSDIVGPGFFNFSFAPIKDSTAQDYYFELSFDGSGNLKIGSAPGNSYLSGAQYIGGTAQNSQSSFRIDYDPTRALVGLFSEGLSWFGLLSLGIIMFVLPGWAALSLLFPPWQTMNWISRISLSIGTGMAFYPVLLLWMDTLGIYSNLLNALILPVLGLVFVLLTIFRGNNVRGFSLKRLFSKPDPIDKTSIKSNRRILWQGYIPDLAFLVILVIIIFTRMWPIRILDAPMWGDSYQHTMIAQLMVDNGGLFSSWEPYAQLESHTYHFGFHSLVSVFHWFSGIDVIQSTLWVGQILNIFAIVALYPLAVMIGKNKWAGVIAIVIAGLISSMPMYYVNWGRYTQLAGQIILPVIVVILWKNLDSEQNNTRWNSLVWFGFAGLALTHYRVTIFIPLFYVSYFLFQLRNHRTVGLIKRLIIHAVGVVILILPWAIRIFEGALPRIFGTQISTAASSVSQAAQDINTIGNITGYLPIMLWLLVLFAIGWGIWTRNQKSNIFSLWWLLILLAANPNWLHLPGTGILTNFAVFIAAYIPAGILIGSSSASVLNRVGIIESSEISLQSDQGSQPIHRKYLVWSIFLFIFLILISASFVQPRIRDVQPAAHVLLTRPDLRAGEWIDQHLPSDAKFLVNSFFAYGGTLVVGSDGGWWLPLLTSRDSSQPPLTYGSEKGVRPDFVADTNSLVALIEEKGINHPEVLSELKERGITHLYIGQQQGQVNSNSHPLFEANSLITDPQFSPVYNEDRVWIFEIISPEG